MLMGRNGWPFFCGMEALAVVQDVIPREGKVLSPGHLTEMGFVPRGLLALDIPALMEKAQHSCHLYVFSHAVSGPQTEGQHLFFFFFWGKERQLATEHARCQTPQRKGLTSLIQSTWQVWVSEMSQPWESKGYFISFKQIH